ncbi:toprim domain-containing protein [Ferruginibacter paludis]|uniref:toprim domain-containing protein n=1 Tax=Ferruginibacter paludis TaxID=1310417 RepID=UPI0025B5667B|nr:toprim domain-containing protein [Ferruginibacter paludis]MDN3657071.1 toprim domain-containing protein [Ferruginibacter paludis]
MKTNHLSINEIKQLDMVAYLEKLGYQPQTIKGNDYWYLSPLRTESVASFKINRELNAWYDHGMGKGGNLVDFGILYHNCSVQDFIEKVSSGIFLFHQQPDNKKDIKTEEQSNKIQITLDKAIEHPALLYYLTHRGIPREIALQYCREVHYELNDKNYYAIGFRNNAGGYELRNAFFKGSSSPKDATLIQTPGALSLTVLEGFFSFLSWQTFFGKQQLATDFLVLNSLALMDKNSLLVQNYPATNLLLDNDAAGDKATVKMLALNPSISDGRKIYQGYKDLNQLLTEKNKQLRTLQVKDLKKELPEKRQQQGRKM